MNILYTNGSRINCEVTLSIFKYCPANCPDAIGRKVDAIGKNLSKKAYFSRFSENLTYLTIPYGQEIFNQCRWSYATSLPEVLESLV